MVFYVLLKKQEKSQIVMPIWKEQQRRWNVSAAELFFCAMENTPRLSPTLRGISEILLETAMECGNEEGTEIQLPDFLKPDRELFYVLSTDSCICRASVLLYKDVLQWVAEWLDTDLAVVPSSIHEVLLMILDGNANIRELRDMLHSVNMEEVDEMDRLSENIYLYRRKKGCPEVAQDVEFQRRAV